MAPTNRPKSQIETKSATPASMPQELNIAGRHAHDRLLFLMANWVGCEAHVTLKNQDRFTGIFSTASIESSVNSIALKMSWRLPYQTGDQTNGILDTSPDYVGYGPDHVMTFDIKDIVNVEVPSATTDKVQQKHVNGSSLRTDTEISGNLELRERPLEAWTEGSAPAVDMSMNGAASGTWDQFKTNEKLFGLKSDYDETFYTTAIDRSDPTYKERYAKADRMAREIESGETNNPHVAEERNLISPEMNGTDEEAKYSGVARQFTPLTSSNSNRYTPPARRAPTGHSTVAGAPVDPAIISSSLAQPNTSNVRLPPKDDGVAPLKENSKPELANTNGVKVDNMIAKMPQEVSHETPASRLNYEGAKERLKAMGASLPHVNAPSQPSDVASSGKTMAEGNLENQVSGAFHSFAAEEKLKAARNVEIRQEQQREIRRREKDSRLNDLKKFSTNFQVGKPIPRDILGILAHDKKVQNALEAKNNEEIEAKKAKAAASALAAAEKLVPPAQADRQISKSARSQQSNQDQGTGKIDRSNMPQNRTIGNLGQRLASNQQYGTKGMPNGGNHMPPQDTRVQTNQSTSINTDVGSNRQTGGVTPASATTRMRPSANEFKPNPAATSFQMPRDQPSPALSPARSRAKSDLRQKPVNRVKFFKGKRPEAGSKKPLSEGFNPVRRMAQEVARSEKSKEYNANGGIPQAYRTAPTWPVSQENENRTYVDVADKVLLPDRSATPSPYPMAHQHQLPPHFNQGGYYGGPRTPSQIRQHPHKEYFDPHRMHPSASQSSVPPSPSMRQQGMVPQQGGFNGQPVYPQPGTPGRQFAPQPHLIPAGGPGAPPMMMSHSNQGQFVNMPQGQVPMYAMANGQMFQGQGPPPGAYGNPRGAPMFVQGQPPMHMQQQFPYPMQGAPGFQHNGPPMQMRGGVPMMQQGSYGSPHMAYPMPQQHRGGGPHHAGNFPQQQHNMQAGPAMSQMPRGPMRQPSDQGDAR